MKILFTFVLISCLLISCTSKEQDKTNDESLNEEYYTKVENLGYTKADNPIEVIPKEIYVDEPYEYYENYPNELHPFGVLDESCGCGYCDGYFYEDSEIYQKSSEMAIVIATKMSSETYVKDKGIFIDDDQNVINDKRIVTVTKMRVDEIAEIIKTSGNTLKVGDFFYILEYRGEYSLEDEIYYKNGLPFAINGTEYRAISSGQSICFLNLDDEPIVISGYTGDDVFAGWWDCTSVSLDNKTYSIADIRYDKFVPIMIEKYAWHLLDK